MGIQTALQSVDKTREPYDLIKDAMLEGRWTGPGHAILKQEGRDLLDQGKKIDHPVRVHDPSGASYRGSKDGTDACAGSVYAAHQHMSEVMQANTISEVLKAQAGQPSAATQHEEAWRRVEQAEQMTNRQLYEAIRSRQDANFGGGMLPIMPRGR